MTGALIMSAMLLLPAPKVKGESMPVTWWAKTQAAAVRHGVDPYFAAAVGYIECAGWKQGPVGRGPNGRRYIGPMGINRCFADRWDIYDPLVNLDVGIRALRGANHRVVLRRYNAQCTRDYESAVLRLCQQFHEEAGQ